jgi:acyl carrier protein
MAVTACGSLRLARKRGSRPGLAVVTVSPIQILLPQLKNEGPLDDESRGYGQCHPRVSNSTDGKQRHVSATIPHEHMNSDILSKVKEVLKGLFDVNAQSISLETKATDIPAWDSVGHLSLCGALDETFELRLAVDEMADIDSVRAIVSIIEEKKKAA